MFRIWFPFTLQEQLKDAKRQKQLERDNLKKEANRLQNDSIKALKNQDIEMGLMYIQQSVNSRKITGKRGAYHKVWICYFKWHSSWYKGWRWQVACCKKVEVDRYYYYYQGFPASGQRFENVPFNEDSWINTSELIMAVTTIIW